MTDKAAAVSTILGPLDAHSCLYARMKSARAALIAEGHLVEKPLGQATRAEIRMIRERVELEEMAAPYGGAKLMFDTWDRECADATGPLTAKGMIEQLAAWCREDAA